MHALLTPLLSAAYSARSANMLFTSSRPLSPAAECRREDADFLEGVHSEPSQALTRLVLERVPELARWEAWYAHPPLVSNGHVHTILAAKLRKARAVRYHRQLVPTPDGGTLAIDLLAGIRRVEQSDDQSSRTIAPGSLLTGGALPGAAEEEGFTSFVPTPPPIDPARPMLLLASGLGGGSQDTYVRSLAAAAAERGWQVAVVNMRHVMHHVMHDVMHDVMHEVMHDVMHCVMQVAVVNMRACGGAPVTSPRLFSAYRGANDDMRGMPRRARAPY